MHVKLSVIRDLLWEDYDDSFEFEMVEQGSWEQDHKTQSCELIFAHKETGKNYSTWAQRSGSYHTDWHYDWDWQDEDVLVEVCEVEKVETVTYAWKAVK